jgi:molybdate transport system ATP-binding protein
MWGTVQRGSFTLGADLVAAPGEVLAVLGPNAAGKTMLLRALSGLDALNSGFRRSSGNTVQLRLQGCSLVACLDLDG